jgi:hypothetical protein
LRELIASLRKDNGDLSAEVFDLKRMYALNEEQVRTDVSVAIISIIVILN